MENILSKEEVVILINSHLELLNNKLSKYKNSLQTAKDIIRNSPYAKEYFDIDFIKKEINDNKEEQKKYRRILNKIKEN